MTVLYCIWDTCRARTATKQPLLRLKKKKQLTFSSAALSPDAVILQVLLLVCAAALYHLPGQCKHFSCHFRDGHVVLPLFKQQALASWAHPSNGSYSLMCGLGLWCPSLCPSCTRKRHQGLKTVGCPTAPLHKMHTLATLYFGGLHPISSPLSGLFSFYLCCAQLVTCTAAPGSMLLSGGHFLFPASALQLWCRGRAGSRGEALGQHLGRQVCRDP